MRSGSWDIPYALYESRKKKQYNARQGVEGSILLQALIIYAFVYVYLLVQFYP